MKKMWLAFVFLITSPLWIYGATTVDAEITFELDAINEFSIPAGANDTLTINHPDTPAVDSSLAYNVSTNSSTNKRILAKYSVTPASTLTISCTVEAPTGGTSSGETTLSTTDTAVVTGVSSTFGAGLEISIKATADWSDAPDDYVYTFTFTLTD